MHYNWNRYYDPESGRYSQTDPIGFEGGVNFYSYVENDPIDYYDPNAFGKIGTIIKFSKKVWKHIANNHIKIGIYLHKSKFKDPSSIKKNIYKTVKNPDRIIRQKDGRILYEKNFGRKIGTDGETIQRVVVDKHGNIITSFPSHNFKSKTIIPGSTLGVSIFGDNIFGNTLDFFNPMSDIQDIIYIFEDDEDYFQLYYDNYNIDTCEQE